MYRSTQVLGFLLALGVSFGLTTPLWAGPTPKPDEPKKGQPIPIQAEPIPTAVKPTPTSIAPTAITPTPTATTPTPPTPTPTPCPLLQLGDTGCSDQKPCCDPFTCRDQGEDQGAMCVGATPTPVTPTPTPGGSEDCDTRSQSSTLEEKNAGFFTCSEDGSADSEVLAEQLTIDRLGGELCDSKLCISGKCDTGGCQSADPDLEGVEVGKCSLVGDSKAAEDRIVELEREAGALLEEADGLRKDLGDSPDLRDSQKKMEEKMQEALEANHKASDLKAIAKTCKESEKVFECQLSGTVQCRCDCVSTP